MTKKGSVIITGFPGSSDGKVSAYNVGDPGLIPGSGRSPGEGPDTKSQLIQKDPDAGKD